MLNIVEVLGISWSSVNIIYDYIKGAVWWAIAVDAILLAASIFLAEL